MLYFNCILRWWSEVFHKASILDFLEVNVDQENQVRYPRLRHSPYQSFEPTIDQLNLVSRGGKPGEVASKGTGGLGRLRESKNQALLL